MLVSRNRDHAILDLGVDVLEEIALLTGDLEIPLSPIEVECIAVYLRYMIEEMICLRNVLHGLILHGNVDLWHCIGILALWFDS